MFTRSPAVEILYIEGAKEFIGAKSDNAVRGMVARHQIPFRKLGGRVVFIKSELEAFLLRLPGVGVDEALERRVERKSASG